MKNWIENIIVALVGFAMVAGIFLLGIAAAGAIVLAFNVVPWALWNYAVAPTFGWPACGFWKMFFLVWAISWVSRLIRGSGNTKS